MKNLFAAFGAIIVLSASVAGAAPKAVGADVAQSVEAVAKPAAQEAINVGDAVGINTCQTDADCKDADPNDCKLVKCVPYKSQINPATGEATTLNMCQSYANPNCGQGTCTSKYAGDDVAIKCCDMKLDGDPAQFECCKKNIAAGISPIDAAGNIVPCKDCPQCPDCPPPPKVNCDLIGDPKMKSCCTEVGGLLWFVMDKCVPDGPDGSDGCNIVINAGGDFINNGQLNICCQVVNNTGTITDTTISQACNNTTGGGPGGGTATGGTPTIPEGSASALTCSVTQVGAPVDGKFAIAYTVPASAGAVVSATLTQISGTQIKVEGEAEPSDFGATVTSPKAMGTKSVSDPENPPSFMVFASTPKSMTGEWKAPFEVKVTLNTLDGEAGSALCTEDAFLHAQGTGCGCNMTTALTTREQMVASAVLAFLLAIPMFALRFARTSTKK